MNTKTLVLGLGNNILMDDGIGPRLVYDIAQMTDKPDVVFNTASCGGLEIMEYIKGYKKVVFIDSIRTRNGKPGDVYYFVPADFKETSHLSSLHDINFLTALKLGASLNMDLPVELHIIAIEIVEDMEFSEDLTPELEEKYSTIFDAVFALVKKVTD
jgi:hydrogenase maturation protease